MQISAAARVRGERHLQPPPCSLKIVRQRRRPSSATLICIRTDLHVSQDVAWLSYLLLQMKKDSILNPSQHDLTWPELIWLDLTWPDLTWPELNSTRFLFLLFSLWMFFHEIWLVLSNAPTGSGCRKGRGQSRKSPTLAKRERHRQCRAKIGE